MYKLSKNEMVFDDDLLYYYYQQQHGHEPLKQLKLDEILLYFLQQEDSNNEGDADYESIDEDLNIINMVINEIYLSELRAKSSIKYWNSLNQENDKDKCISQFEGEFKIN